ncbi:MAG: hypothetical protein ACK55I_08095, partial [bacterium]
MRTDDFRHEVGRHFQHILNRGTLETFAKDGRHGPRQGLHLRAKRDAETHLAVGIHGEKNTHRVGALLVLAHIFQFELLAVLRHLRRRLIGIGDQSLALFFVGQCLEEIDDLLEFRGVRHGGTGFSVFQCFS